MKVSQLRELLSELQYEHGDVDVLALVTKRSGYLLDCHYAKQSDPLIRTGEDYTIVCANPCQTECGMMQLDGFPPPS